MSQPTVIQDGVADGSLSEATDIREGLGGGNIFHVAPNQTVRAIVSRRGEKTRGLHLGGHGGQYRGVAVTREREIDIVHREAIFRHGGEQFTREPGGVRGRYF